MNSKFDGLCEFLQRLSGSDAQPLLLVRDPGPGVGWRSWTQEDSDALLGWASRAFGERSDESRYGCFNQKQLSELMGVSVPKVTEWLRRVDYPLPHIKNGRVILVPTFILEEWMREESARSNLGGVAGSGFLAVYR